MNAPRTIRLGTRASPLARWQADWVAGELQARGVVVELVHITTTGDVTTGPLGAQGGQGLFTKEIQRALLDDRIDLAVHSLKDLPTEPVEGLIVAAVPQRESSRDVLVSRGGESLAKLPQRAKVGTGSLRRRAQLLHVRPDLEFLDVRGNVDTRLRKLSEGQYDALVLAEAGLNRLGLAENITEVLPLEIMLPAPGQGALGLECRTSDTATQAALAPLNHPSSRAAAFAERALLFSLRAGCLAPVGAWARTAPSGELALDAVVLSANGGERLYESASGSLTAPEELGQRVAQSLLARGAGQLITAARSGV